MKAKLQRTRIGEQLIKLAPNITAPDRNGCARKFKISKVLISYYLNGRVTNEELGLQMIEYFRECINNRDAKLNNLCQPN